MKNKLVKMGLEYAGKRLDGKKTYAGAAGKIITGVVAILSGVVGFLGIMFPDQGLPEIPVETNIAMLSGGFYAISSGLQGIGIGHKIEKAKDAKIVAGLDGTDAY